MERIRLYKPELQDLWFRQQLLEDEDTMAFNVPYGGTIPFPQERWDSWYEVWVNHPTRAFYRYVQNEQGFFVGEVAYRYDEEIQGYVVNVIIFSKNRNKGYGGLALEALCREAKANGIDVLYDDIEINNPSLDLFLKHGFKILAKDEKKTLVRKDL